MLIRIGCISKNVIFMQFYVTIPEIPSFEKPALTVTKNNWLYSSCKLIMIVHSGTLRTVHTIRLMSFFRIIA